MKLQNQIFVLPSEKAAERKQRELLEQNPTAVWIGENVYSLPHFLNALANPSQPLLKRMTQKHLIAHCLKTIPLRHFEKLKTFPSLAQTFLEAIRQLKRWGFSVDALHTLLAETGSLKEYDLVRIYEDYETLKEKLGWIDEEDLFALARRNLKTNQPLLVSTTELVFQHFIEKPKALTLLLETVSKIFPKLKITWSELPEIKPTQLQHVKLFSLPTPFQETDWFIYQIETHLKQGTALSAVGILPDGSSLPHEAIFQKLKNLSLAQDPSPFLTWRSLPAGREILTAAVALELTKAPLPRWLEVLGPFPLLEDLRFQDFLISFGDLTKSEWLSWVSETLDEKPELKTSQALSSLQWLSLSQGDFPNLDFLWVPQLIEGNFPKATPSIFFQDSKDRSRPEFSELAQAFPDAAALFRQKQKAFLHQLSQTKQEVWLTYPRLDSLGQDVSPSPFSWDFSLTENITKVEPVMRRPETIDQRLWTNDEEKIKSKIGIEEERLRTDLQTKEYHAVLEPIPWQEKVAPMRAEHIFSPSQLETYAQCPFKYYANRVLEIPEQKEYAPELDPDDKGTLFHDCLEIFLKENRELFLAARLDPTKEEPLYEKLSQTVEAVFAKNRLQYPYGHPELYNHLQQKTLNQAREVLVNELEEARSVEEPLEPTWFEWKFGMDGAKPLALAETQLGGRIDRVDIDPKTNHFLVIDYKTGSVQKFKERSLQGLALQLPIYILAVRSLLLSESQAVGGLLIETKTASKKTGLVDESFNQTHFAISKRAQALLSRQELEEAIALAVGWVGTYVQQIRSGFFSAQPKECKPSCNYKEICRYAGKPFV